LVFATNTQPHRINTFLSATGIYGFNQLVSDEISLDRTVPDVREKECKHWDYPQNLPTISVIFIFHNEGWSTLLRSIINRYFSFVYYCIIINFLGSNVTHRLHWFLAAFHRVHSTLEQFLSQAVTRPWNLEIRMGDLEKQVFFISWKLWKTSIFHQWKTL